MNLEYEEIYDMANFIGREVEWYGIHGEPRFTTFNPRAATVYADQCALVEIACQNCGQLFPVAAEWHNFSSFHILTKLPNPDLRQQFADGSWHYGDPPNTSCCPAGPTMNSEPRRLLQFWERDDLRQWIAVTPTPAFTVPDWVDDGREEGFSTHSE